MKNEPDEKDEKIFDLKQEIIYLKGQITYLQEELSRVEDELDYKIEHHREIVEAFEMQLGEALAGK